MKRMSLLLAALILAGTCPLQADPISKADRNKVVKELNKTRKGVEGATKGLSAAQWSFKAAPDRWSVAECVEHLTLSEDFLRGLVTDRVLKTPAAPEKKNAEKQAQVDAQVLKMIADRSFRAQAPEGVRPTGKWADTKALMAEFKARRKKTVEFVKNSPEDLRAHFRDSPVIKELDAVQWILFLSAHTERHTKQLLEVKADPGFPKR